MHPCGLAGSCRSPVTGGWKDSLLRLPPSDAGNSLFAGLRGGEPGHKCDNDECHLIIVIRSWLSSCGWGKLALEFVGGGEGGVTCSFKYRARTSPEHLLGEISRQLHTASD